MASQGAACRGCATADVLSQRVLYLEAKNAELETALRVILVIGRTASPVEDRKAIDGIAREALGGTASVGASMRVVDGSI